jgi:hypothetical protein
MSYELRKKKYIYGQYTFNISQIKMQITSKSIRLCNIRGFLSKQQIGPM